MNIMAVAYQSQYQRVIKGTQSGLRASGMAGGDALDSLLLYASDSLLTVVCQTLVLKQIA
jgi:hypothetical protein